MQITTHDCSVIGCCINEKNDKQISASSALLTTLKNVTNCSLQVMTDTGKAMCQLADKHPRMVIAVTAVTVGVMAVSGLLPLQLALMTASTAAVTSIGSLLNHPE